MPRKQISTEETKAVNKEKSSQNSIKPAKQVKIRPKTKQKEISIAKVESGQSDNTLQQTPAAVQKNTTSQKQISRSAIQFVAAMNYLIFFFGFCACRHEPYARFHQNQALWMWIIVTVLYLGFAFIPTVNVIAIPFVIMIHIIWVIAGVSTALRGRAYSVPVVGKIKIVDWEKV